MLQERIREALKQGYLSSRNLSAFSYDADYYLEQTGLFSRIKTKKTGEPECALLVTCTLADPSTAKSKVAETLATIWKKAPLGYGGKFDAFETEDLSDRINMSFVTVADYGAAVTGRIEVVGFRTHDTDDTQHGVTGT